MLSGLLELELTMLGLPWFIKACGINTATFFSLSVLPMELNVQDSAQLWYPTVPPLPRGLTLQPFSNDRDQMISDASQNILACETKCS